MPADFENLLHKVLAAVARTAGERALELLDQGQEILDKGRAFADGAAALDPKNIMVCALCRRHHPPHTKCGSMPCPACMAWHVGDEHIREEGANEPGGED